jgi:IclR family transcriptional regulator, acetate operon repressor
VNTIPMSVSVLQDNPGFSADEAVSGSEVRSVDRAASILIALGGWDGEAGVTELARSLGLHKSTASRLLATLQKRGLVQQDGESGKYRLGLALVRLGSQAERTLDLRSMATPELVRTARSVREATTLGVLDSDSVMTVAWADASGMAQSRIDRYLPLHATATGKALLAQKPEREIIRISKPGLRPFTSQTIVRVDLLLQEIAAVRRRGYATAFGEHQVAVNAVAVPVFGNRGDIVAAVAVRAPGNRISPGRVPELVEQIRDTAAAITRHIGGVVPT